MKSGTIPVVYALYTPTMSLQDYETKLNQPNGTHASQKCGGALGSFLACYLETNVINVPEAEGIERLNKDAEHIDRLLSQKNCKIIFDNNTQLQAVFEKIRKKIDLYRELLEKGYLSAELQCKNDNTFLHDYLNQLSWKDEEALRIARDLIELDQSGLSVRGEAGYPITIILNKIVFAVTTNQLTNQNVVDLLNLLKICQPDWVSSVLNQADQSVLLKACFELLSRPTLPNIALLGFEAAIAAASLGMPLDKPLEGCADGATSLFAHILELDTTHEWGIDAMRRLMQCANPGVLKLTVKTNPEAMKSERLSEKRPDDVSSYVYITDRVADKADAVYEQAKKDDLVMDLEVASEFYKVSDIIAVWKAGWGGTLDYVKVKPGSQPRYGLNSYLTAGYNTNYCDGSVSLCHLSEHYLPLQSKYRETITDGDRQVPKYSVTYVAKGGYGYDKSNVEYSLVTTLVGKNNNYPYYNNSNKTAEAVPSALKRIIAADKTGGNFFSKLEAAYRASPTRSLQNYYHRRQMHSEPSVRKNALLVYLEKGGAVEKAEHLHPLQFYSMKRDFKLVSTCDPQVVTFQPGQIPLSSVLKCEATGEFLLRPTSDSSENGITTFRVYDFELLKQFKKLGFDFSSLDVTTWLAAFLAQEMLSPSLFELLACLKACGAIFPQTINDKSYNDFMNARFQACKLEYAGWVRVLNGLEKPSLERHLLNLELPLNPELELTAEDYSKKLEEKYLLLSKARVDYPQLLGQWVEGIHSEALDMSGEIYDQVLGNFSLAIECLEAYIASGDYQNDALDNGVAYFNFFLAVIKQRLQLFNEESQASVLHTSNNKSALTNKLSMFNRARSAASVLRAIKGKIDQILSMSAGSHDDKMKAIALYAEVNAAIKEEAEKNSIDSSVVNACFKAYDTKKMFIGESINLSSFASRSIILDVVPAEMQARVVNLLANIKQEQPADATYKPNKAQPQPPEPKPSAPPVYELYPKAKDEAPPAPTLPSVFEARCLAYKAALDAFYNNGNMAQILDYLNLNIAAVKQHMAVLPAPLAMLLPVDTKQFTQYPCVIDQNHLVYYDLDHLCEALKNGGVVPGIEGPLTPERISFKPLSEIMMMVFVLDQAKAKLELVAQPEMESAYSMGRGSRPN